MLSKLCRNAILVPRRDFNTLPHRKEIIPIRLKEPGLKDRETNADNKDWIPKNSFWPAIPGVRKGKYGFLTVLCVTIDFTHMPWGISLDCSGLPVYPIVNDEYACQEFIALDMDQDGKTILKRRRCLCIVPSIHYGYITRGKRTMAVGIDIHLYEFRTIVELIMLHHDLSKSGNLSEMIVCDANGFEVPTNTDTGQFAKLMKFAAGTAIRKPCELYPNGSPPGLFLRISTDYVQHESEERALMILPEKCYRYEIAMYDEDFRQVALDSKELFKVDPDLLKRMEPVTEKLQDAVHILPCKRDPCCYEDEDECRTNSNDCPNCCIDTSCSNQPMIYDVLYDEYRTMENTILHENCDNFNHLEDMFNRESWKAADIKNAVMALSPDLADAAAGAFARPEKVYEEEKLRTLYYKLHMVYVNIVKMQAFTQWAHAYNEKFMDFLTEWTHAKFVAGFPDSEFIKRYKIGIIKTNMIAEAKELARIIELSLREQPKPKIPVKTAKELKIARGSFLPKGLSTPLKKSSRKRVKSKKSKRK